jgi:hypothetical protein
MAEPFVVSPSRSSIRDHATGADLGTTGPPHALKGLLLWFWGVLPRFSNLRFCFFLLGGKRKQRPVRILFSRMGYAMPVFIPPGFKTER